MVDIKSNEKPERATKSSEKQQKATKSNKKHNGHRSWKNQNRQEKAKTSNEGHKKVQMETKLKHNLCGRNNLGSVPSNGELFLVVSFFNC